MTIATPAVRPVVTPPATRTSAVVWINGRRALVARSEPEHGVSTHPLDRGIEPESAWLARVVEAIGDRERVVILGPGSERLALEREYVAIFRRPDRLVDVEPGGPVDEAELVTRLRQLTG